MNTSRPLDSILNGERFRANEKSLGMPEAFLRGMSQLLSGRAQAAEPFRVTFLTLNPKSWCSKVRGCLRANTEPITLLQHKVGFIC
jgi:hypothetical protein